MSEIKAFDHKKYIEETKQLKFNPNVKSRYKIIDNALRYSDFFKIQQYMESPQMPWSYNSKISGAEQSAANLGFFSYIFYHGMKPYNHFDILDPIISIIRPCAIIRIKANLYINTNQKEPIVHGLHRDMPFPHQAALFYINTNNGFTILEDGTKIESIANRLLLFDAHAPHTSTDCTDAAFRMNINFNFFSSQQYQELKIIENNI